MGTPIVALAKLLAVSNFYRDVLGYDAFGDDNKAVAIVANDHRGGKDSNNASAGYGRSKNFHANFCWSNLLADNRYL